MLEPAYEPFCFSSSLVGCARFSIFTTPRELWSGPGGAVGERAGEGERDPGGKTNSLGGTYLSSGNKNKRASELVGGLSM